MNIFASLKNILLVLRLMMKLIMTTANEKIPRLKRDDVYV